MLEDHESHRVHFLKRDSLKNFGHTTNTMMRLMFLHSKCYLLCIKVFSIATFCLGHGIFQVEGSRIVSWLRKNMFFLRIFFFWGPICYKISKIPKISIYVYLTISMIGCSHSPLVHVTSPKLTQMSHSQMLMKYLMNPKPRIYEYLQSEYT